MMDGRVGYIRKVLDEAGYTGVYHVLHRKICQCFYGPFRDALDSALNLGIKRPIR